MLPRPETAENPEIIHFSKVIFLPEKKKRSKLSFQMILRIDEGIGGCVLDREKMGWVPRLETAENTEFLKSVIFYWTFLGTQKTFL